MRILFLSQIIPYPPDAGPRVKTWNVLRYLVERGHQVTLVSFVRPDEAPHVTALQQICTAVHTVPIRRSRLADAGYLLRSNLTGRPFLIERDDLPAMRQLVRRLLATESFDVVHADQLTMTQFALDAYRENGGGPDGRRPFTIFDAHNATWTISNRMFENVPWFLKMMLRLETPRIKQYEGMLVERFDHTMVVIEPDKSALLQGVANGMAATAARRITVIPIAVDTVALQPIQRRPLSRNIMTLGSLNYPPNVDGIRWFLHHVFPLIRQQTPDVTLTIIGKTPPPDFVQLSEQNPGVITVTGYVPDLTPYMEAAALMVVPVRAGSGMRVRLLEAFARAMPAVTTTIGLEGIDAEPGRDVLVADDPADFAAATVRLLQDEQQQGQLAVNGRRLAETRYDWQVALKKMDEVYAQANR
jgi:polysaccharide biosynthesis protein PslH